MKRKSQFFLCLLLIANIFLWISGIFAGQGGITGNIGFFGTVTINSSSVATATAITSFINPVSDFPQGDYTNVPNYAAVNLSPFTFNPSTPIIPFWTYTNNGIIYRFNSLAISYLSQLHVGNGDFLNISGMGLAHITGFADTPAMWSFSTQSPSSGTYNGQPIYTFAASLSCAATNIPTLNLVSQTNGQIILKWNAGSGFPYQVQMTTNLIQGNWSNFGNLISATNSTVYFTNSIGTNLQQFYRVIIPD